MRRALFVLCCAPVLLSACGSDGPTPPGGGLVITPSAATVAFGAIGSTRLLTATVTSGGAPVAGATVSWAVAGGGTRASVSPVGLVTALTVGTGDTAVGTFTGAEGTATTRVPITVAQLVATVTVASAAGATPDTLFTSTRTRQFTAAALDSNGNAVAGALFTWNSTVTTAATINGAGLATAQAADGTTQISATSAGKQGNRPLVVHRFPTTFTLNSAGGTIDQGQTLALSGTAQDSVGANVPITWISRNTSVAAPNPIVGTTSAAFGIGGGMTRLVMQAKSRTDSVSITVNNLGIVISFAGTVQPIFTSTCATVGCHTGAAPTGSQNLTAGVARANLVNVSAVGFAGAVRVIPANADNSYLVRKLENRNIIGSQMPEGVPPLTATQIGQIRMWILAGAANN